MCDSIAANLMFQLSALTYMQRIQTVNLKQPQQNHALIILKLQNLFKSLKQPIANLNEFAITLKKNTLG